MFEFKWAIICREGLTRISYEFVGHFASLGTRKYTNNATATYNLFESMVLLIQRHHRNGVRLLLLRKELGAHVATWCLGLWVKAY